MSKKYPISSSVGKLRFAEGGDLLSATSKVLQDSNLIVIPASSGQPSRVRWSGGAAVATLIDADGVGFSGTPVLVLSKGEQVIQALSSNAAVITVEGVAFSWDLQAYHDMDLDAELVIPAASGDGNFYARVLLRKWHD